MLISRIRPWSHQALASLVVRSATAPAPWWLRRPTYARSITFPTADGLTLHGWCVEPSQPTATLVLGHGYREHRQQLMFLAPLFAARGVRVVAFDFRAHGRSPGRRISFGVNEAHDVDAALDFAATFATPVWYLGFSMGASAYLLARREAAAAVLDSPYDTLERAVTLRLRNARWPAALDGLVFVRGAQHLGVDVATIRPVEALPRLQNPTLLIFARQDTWIPAAAREAFERQQHPNTTLVTLEEGGHADHFTPAWRDQVVSFFFPRKLARAHGVTALCK